MAEKTEDSKHRKKPTKSTGSKILNYGHPSAWGRAIRIVGFLVAAAMLALGHHFFYRLLNGKPVYDTSQTWRGVYQAGKHGWRTQQFTRTVGNLFSQAVQATMSATITNAFLQCAWRVVRLRTWSVTGLDALFASTTSMFAFLKVDLWKSGRVFILVVAVSYALPFVSSLAASSLLTVGEEIYNTTTCVVPTMDLAAQSKILFDVSGDGTPSFLQYDASFVLQRVVQSTMLGGSPFTPSATCDNCTYSVSFAAPAYKCSEGLSDAFAATIYPDVPEEVNYLWTVQLEGNDNDYDFYGKYENLVQGETHSAGNFSCILYNATYTVDLAFVSSNNLTINHIDFPDDEFSVSSSLEQVDPSIFVNGTVLSDVQISWISFSYLMSAVLDHLYDNVTAVYPGVGQLPHLTSGRTQFAPLKSNLVLSADQNGVVWTPDIPNAIEQLLQNITLSLFTLNWNVTAQVECVYVAEILVFSYRPRTLWGPYGAGLAVSLVCALIGLGALWTNKFGGTADFSQFLAATRNTDLDHDVEEQTVLRYGRVPLEPMSPVSPRPSMWPRQSTTPMSSPTQEAAMPILTREPSSPMLSPDPALPHSATLPDDAARHAFLVIARPEAKPGFLNKIWSFITRSPSPKSSIPKGQA